MANGLFAGGDGTILNPYLIEDAHDLNAVRNALDKNYKLIRDIDLDIDPYNTGVGWIPISTFAGTLDGDGYTISNLFIRRTEGYSGLFGATNGVKITNLGMIDVDIQGTTNIGAIVGYFYRQYNTRENLISNCYSTGILSSTTNTLGGIAGATIYEGLIKNCYSTAILNSAAGYTGGIAGTLQGFTAGDGGYCQIQNCYFAGIINGSGTIGGLVGFKDTIIPNSANSFWDIEASTRATSASGIGLTTQQMKTKLNYSNTGWEIQELTDGTKIWKFNIEDNKYYPRLWFEDNFPQYKWLIKSNNILYTFINDIWSPVEGELSQALFETYGINDIKNITNEQWNQLAMPITLYNWTDYQPTTSSTITYTQTTYPEKTLELTVPEHRIIDQLDAPVSIVTYTDAETPPSLLQQYDYPNVGARILKRG